MTAHKCDECGQTRINTPSGSVCPRGHGRLHPRIVLGRLETLNVPSEIASCPECRGDLAVERAGDVLHVLCLDSQAKQNAYEDGLRDDDGEHACHPDVWQPVRDKVAAWLGCEDGIAD